MKCIGFDLSTTKSGWATVVDTRLGGHGTICPIDEIALVEKRTKTFVKENLTETQIFRYQMERIATILREERPDVMVVEDAFMKFNASVLRMLARLSGGALAIWIQHYDLKAERCYTVMASSARAYVGAKGNWKKPQVVEYVNNEFGFPLTDDNEADAAILAMYGYLKTVQVKARK